MDKKKCSKCHTLLDINLFSKGNRYCKECHKKYKNEWLDRGDNRTKEHIRQKIWVDNNKELYMSIHRNGTKKYYEKNPEIQTAHTIASKYRLSLIKECCEVCGSKENLELHHPDYSKPLEVITLCRKCHVSYTFNKTYEKTTI